MTKVVVGSLTVRLDLESLALTDRNCGRRLGLVVLEKLCCFYKRVEGPLLMEFIMSQNYGMYTIVVSKSSRTNELVLGREVQKGIRHCSVFGWE